MIDKIYLNLQEQVAKNKDDIELLNQFQIAASAFGFKPRGVFATRPAFSNYNIDDVVFVGVNPPYEAYVKLEGEASWKYFGKFPRAGSQGEIGPSGERGIQGVRGPKVYLRTSAPQPLEVVDEGQLEGDFCLLINGEIYTYIIDEGILRWTYFTQIRGSQGIPGRKGDTGFAGPQGETGPQGPQGDPGAFIHIGGVKSSVGQLPGWGGLTPMPSDPSLAYFVGDNPEIYLNDLYIQVGEIRENREWINIGTINIATYVTVNGQFVGNWNADTKLDKNTNVTVNWQCYVKRQDGSQTMIDVGDPRNAYCIAQSDQYGRLQSADPANNADVVTRQYANSHYNHKHGDSDVIYIYNSESDAYIGMSDNMNFSDSNGSVFCIN